MQVLVRDESGISPAGIIQARPPCKLLGLRSSAVLVKLTDDVSWTLIT